MPTPRLWGVLDDGMPEIDYIRWFSHIRLSDVPVVGGKNASLGELYSSLTAQGMRVPNGFAVNAQAYRDALTAANAWISFSLTSRYSGRRLIAQFSRTEDRLHSATPPKNAGILIIRMIC